MRFDNGLFAFNVPTGWEAGEADDGTVFVTSDTDGLWVSIEHGGVNTEGKAVSAAEFALSAYSDAYFGRC
jgi:hypothetical protein